MAKGIKLMVVGLSGSGKTTVTKSLSNLMAINADHSKEYRNTNAKVGYVSIYPYRHFKTDKIAKGRYTWKGIESFRELIKKKKKAYSDLHGKPKYLIIDTTTSLFNKMIAYNSATHNNIYGSLGLLNEQTIDELNTIIEQEFIEVGVHVILLAHAVYSEEEDRYIIPTKGSKAFAANGGWLSYVDDASYVYVDKDANARYIAHKTLGLPCKSSLGEDIEEEQLIGDYSLEEHIAQLIKYNEETATATEL